MKKLVITAFVILLSMTTFAQPNDRMRERIKAQKVAFITERLDLSAKEAQQFWPIYNAYEDQVNSYRKNDLKEVRQAMRNGNLSDAEAQSILDKFMAVEDKLHNAKKELVADLRNVLPAQKIIALKAAEDAFNKKLIEMLQKRRENMQNRKNKN